MCACLDHFTNGPSFPQMCSAKYYSPSHLWKKRDPVVQPIFFFSLSILSSAVPKLLICVDFRFLCPLPSSWVWLKGGLAEMERGDQQDIKKMGYEARYLFLGLLPFSCWIATSSLSSKVTASVRRFLPFHSSLCLTAPPLLYLQIWRC